MIRRSNYLLVRRYLHDLGEIYQLSGSSLGRYRFYLRHLLLWSGETPFQQAAKLRPTFPSYVSNLPGRNAEAPLASVTQKKIIEVGKRFFTWGKQNYPKEFGSLTTAWLESLRAPRIRETNDEHEYISLEEVLILIAIPHDNDDLALMRDKAAAAMLFLSGARASAFTTLPISAIDLPARTIRQWPELGVVTKNGKRATTYLLPIPEILSAQSCHRQPPGTRLSLHGGVVSPFQILNQERIATRRWISAYAGYSIWQLCRINRPTSFAMVTQFMVFSKPRPWRITKRSR